MRALHLVVAALVASTLGAASAHADRRSAPSSRPVSSRSCKPQAPVALTAVARRTAAGWRVVVDAVPSRAVDAVAVAIDGRPTRFGATAAREVRHLEVAVDLAGQPGRDVVVSAEVAGRNVSAVVRVGAPAPAAKPPAITERVIGGVVVAEVRP